MDIPQRIFAALDAIESDLAEELVCEDRHSSAVTSSFKTALVQFVFDLMYCTESILF